MEKEGQEQGRVYSGSLDLGVLGTLQLAVFPNNNKKENQPDFAINLMKDNGQ